MKKLVLITALPLTLFLAPLSAPSPVVAQVATSSNQQGLFTPNGQPTSSRTGQSGKSSQAPTTGVICSEEMTATFCNVASGPSNGGYGSSSRSGSSGAPGSSAGAGNNVSSIPPCSTFPPANELCN